MLFRQPRQTLLHLLQQLLQHMKQLTPKTSASFLIYIKSFKSAFSLTNSILETTYIIVVRSKTFIEMIHFHF